MTTKRCPRCLNEKPLDEFAKGNKSQCKECWNAYMRAYYQRSELYRQKLAERSKLDRLRIRMEVLSYYSNGTPHCSCCGEPEYCFLTVDHMVKGQGPEHRRAGITSKKLYHWLKKNGFPPGFRVLCMNCNFALGVHGHCPHQRKEAGILPTPSLN